MVPLTDSMLAETYQGVIAPDGPREALDKLLECLSKHQLIHSGENFIREPDTAWTLGKIVSPDGRFKREAHMLFGLSFERRGGGNCGWDYEIEWQDSAWWFRGTIMQYTNVAKPECLHNFGIIRGNGVEDLLTTVRVAVGFEDMWNLAVNIFGEPEAK